MHVTPVPLEMVPPEDWFTHARPVATTVVREIFELIDVSTMLYVFEFAVNPLIVTELLFEYPIRFPNYYTIFCEMRFKFMDIF